MKAIKYLITALAITTSDINTATAQGTENVRKTNPFGLVYEGAITKNSFGQVNILPVNYKIRGIGIAANVYTPANYDPAKKYPAIVIAHPNGGVKEQVAGLYAQHLAEQGYITITADAAYQGASEGTPRYIDKPANRIEDIYGMADFIFQFKGVDTSSIGLLGICGGGGYSLKAAQSDKRFKAVATVSMFNSGLVRRNGFMNSQVATIQERLKKLRMPVLWRLPQEKYNIFYLMLHHPQMNKLPHYLSRCIEKVPYTMEERISIQTLAVTTP